MRYLIPEPVLKNHDRASPMSIFAGRAKLFERSKAALRAFRRDLNSPSLDPTSRTVRIIFRRHQLAIAPPFDLREECSALRNRRSPSGRKPAATV